MTYATVRRRLHIWLVGSFLALVALGSLTGLAWSWQTVSDVSAAGGPAAGGPAAGGSAAGGGSVGGGSVVVLGHLWTPGSETSLLLLVASGAAVGSMIHAITSFVTYVGNRSYRRSWAAWYLLRPVIGISLGTIAYLVTRAGLMSAAASPADVDPAGAAALGALSGLFSKQASDKLREVFDVAFRTSTRVGDGEREDKPAEETIQVRGLEPARVPVGTARSVRVLGAAFTPGTAVVVAGSLRPTVFEDATAVTVTLTTDDVRSPDWLPVSVFEPRTGAVATAPRLRIGSGEA